MVLMSRAMSLWQKSLEFLRDSIQLGRLQLAERSLPFRSILLREQASNTAAARMLRADKEWSLLKYHGIVPYLRQKRILPDWSSLSQPTTKSAEDIKEEVQSSAPRPAKVAFMITSQMKEELSSLDYTTDDVKKMTPVQASLLLHHKVPPAEMEAQLPQLEHEHEKEQERVAHEELERQAELEKLQAGSILSTTNKEHSSVPDEIKGRIWFELVETKMDSREERVVGLYGDEKDAELGKNVYEKFAERNNTTSIFNVRRTVRA